MLLCSIVSALAMDIAAISQCIWRKRIFPPFRRRRTHYKYENYPGPMAASLSLQNICQHFILNTLRFLLSCISLLIKDFLIGAGMTQIFVDDETLTYTLHSWYYTASASLFSSYSGNATTHFGKELACGCMRMQSNDGKTSQQCSGNPSTDQT